MNLQVVAYQLRAGEPVTFVAHGNSMEPRIHNGAKVSVRPRGEYVPGKGDVVLARVQGHLYLHLVTAVRKGQVQVSNNKGHVNGWTSITNVYGVMVES